ncbi:MAG: hypothetical protein CMQ41_12205 [Gammaproteobacteria bacterium]|nr:hypothetical protein [Gammaproteobacteria bacterium]
MRTIIGLICLINSAILLAETMTLSTPQGELIGSTSTSNENVKVFRGIPYAAPPIGNQRWKPPGDPKKWTGELLATDFGPSCIQAPYPQNSFFYRPSRLTSEDCLYLNVWTTAEAGDNLPVMVWIHGGALTRGSGATASYDGTNLALKGVVLVTINYRLGVFGYFAHSELVTESPTQAAGNYGLLDQMKALEWVQKNISAFGGDPENVTIFGESAGSWSVNLLTASPLAEGLFHKAIGESGGRLDPRMTLDQAIQNGDNLGSAMGADSLAELRAIPAQELQESASANRFRTDGIVDGWSVPQQPYTIFSNGHQNKVPVLVGYNAEEGTTLGVLSRIPENNDVFISRAQNLYGDLAAEYLSIYPADNLRKSTLDSYRDSGFGWNSITWVRMTENVNEDAYLYYFSHRPPGPRQNELGAYHAAEIAYAFNNPEHLRNQATADDQQIADIMSDYWVNFARSGNPNGAGLPRWRPYTKSEPHYVELNVSAQPEVNISPAAWDFFDKIQERLRSN